MRLIVTNAFGAYQRGDAITDAKQIEQVLASDNAANVVKTADLPAPPTDLPAGA